MKNLYIYLFVFSVLSFSCSSNYSNGYRNGFVNKFSERGFIYKTWEGTLNLGGLKKKTDDDNNESYVANTWDFSLDAEKTRGENIQALSDSLLKALDLGLPVKVHYNQEKLTDWNCSRGDENYYIDKVTIIY